MLIPVNRPFWLSVFLLVGMTIRLSAGRAVSTTAPAGLDTLIVEGRYVMGDRDSRLDARNYALLEAKKKALEQAGTYLKAFTRVENYMVSEQEVQTLAAGIMRTEVLEEHTEPAGETMAVVVRIRAIIDSDELKHQLEAARADTALSNQLAELQVEYQRLLAQVEQGRADALRSRPGASATAHSPDWKSLQGMEVLMKLALEARKSQPSLSRAVSLYQQIPANTSGRRAGNGYLGIIQFKRGHVNKAIELLEKAIGEQPASARFSRRPMSRMRGGHSRLPRAVKQRAQHEKALFHYYLARALSAKGARARALRHWKMARQLDPDNPAYKRITWH